MAYFDFTGTTRKEFEAAFKLIQTINSDKINIFAYKIIDDKLCFSFNTPNNSDWVKFPCPVSFDTVSNFAWDFVQIGEIQHFGGDGETVKAFRVSTDQQPYSVDNSNVGFSNYNYELYDVDFWVSFAQIYFGK